MFTITDSNFSEVLDKSNKALVLFWADWCGACKAMKPMLEKAETEVGTPCYTCDIDEASEFTVGLNIKSLPTMVLFDKGKEYKRIVGSIPYQQFKKEFDDWK